MSGETLEIGSIQIEKVYKHGELVYLEFKDLEDPEYSWREFADGDKTWHLDGHLHRESGPAFEWADGTKWWFLKGEHITEEEHRILMTKEVI